MKLAIAMPAYRPIDQRAVLSLMALSGWLGFHQVEWTPIVPRQCAWLDVTQNFIMHRFIESGADKLLFLDDDIVFPLEAAVRLINSDRDVVGGNYRLKTEDLSLRWVCDPMPNGRVEGDYTECGLIGLGFSCLSRKVIEDMRSTNPGSMYQLGSDTPDDGQLAYQLFAPALQQGFKWDPDAVFFNRLRAAGHTPWLDTTIKLGHIGTYVYEAP